MIFAALIFTAVDLPAIGCTQFFGWCFAPWIFAEASDELSVRTWYSTNWHWPASLIIMGLLALAVLVVILYARERGRSSKQLRWLFTALRLALIGLVFVMIFGWHQHASLMDKPDLLIVIDTSSSMGVVDQYSDPQVNALLAKWQASAGAADLTRLNIALALLDQRGQNWLESLSRKYHVKIFQIGSALNRVLESESTPAVDDSAAEPAQPVSTLAGLKAEASVSRLGNGLIDAIKVQRGRPTAAVLFFSDGINTQGKRLSEAAEYAERKSIPLYVLGIGSARPPRDIRLSELLVEDTVFVDDAVNVDFSVHAAGFENEIVKLQLRQKGNSQPLAETEIALSGGNETRQVRLMFRPVQLGNLELEVVALPLNDEVDQANNRLSRTLKVLSETFRVLLVADYPHREFHFLKQLLSRALNASGEQETRAIELKTWLQQGDLEYAATDKTALRVFPVRKEELFEFDVVILLDVRAGEASGPGALGSRELQNLSEFVATRGKGLVIVAGPENRLSSWQGSPAEVLLPFDPAMVRTPDPKLDLTDPYNVRLTNLGSDWSPFQLGDSDQQTQQIWISLPGFFWIAEAHVLKQGTRVLASHATQTGDDGQRLPFVAMHYVGAGKVVFHATAETYRWRFRIGDRYFGRYWVQLIRYLGRSKLSQGSQPITIVSDRDQYQAGDTATLRATFFDDRQAPSDDQGVKVILQQGEGEKRTLPLVRVSTNRGVFETQVESLAEGDYQLWLAEPVGLTDTVATTFRVSAANAEHARLQMDQPALELLAVQTQGRFYTLSNVGNLLNELPAGKQVEVSALPPDPLWRHWYVLLPFAAAFTILLTVEWVLRKWHGML